MNEMLRVGSLVKAGYQGGPQLYTGIVTDIKESTGLISDKYAIIETTTMVHLLREGELLVFDLQEDNIEVIK